MEVRLATLPPKPPTPPRRKSPTRKRSPSPKTKEGKELLALKVKKSKELRELPKGGRRRSSRRRSSRRRRY
jgi:hypothetical protein